MATASAEEDEKKGSPVPVLSSAVGSLSPGVMSSAEELAAAASLSLSVRVLEMETPVELKKEWNAQCRLEFSTSVGVWEVTRTLKEIEVFHANIVVNQDYRGVELPKVPTRKAGSIRKPSDFVRIKTRELTAYLDSIMRRTLLLGSSDIQDFGEFPASVRRLAQRLSEEKSRPVMQGHMKKEGEKFKSYRNRYFVLLPTLLLQYFETMEAYQIGISCKGNIDLSTATKMLVYEDDSMPHSFGIETPKRVWKLQCSSDEWRVKWITALKDLLEMDEMNGYIPRFISPFLSTSAAAGRTGSMVSGTSASSTGTDITGPMDSGDVGRLHNQSIVAEDTVKTRADLAAAGLLVSSATTLEPMMSSDGFLNAKKAAEQISALKSELEKMKRTSEEEKERLLSDMNDKQRDLMREHQEQILGFRGQIEIIAREMQELEEQRIDRDRKHQSDMLELQSTLQKVQFDFEEYRVRAEATITLKDDELESCKSKLDLYTVRGVVTFELKKFVGEKITSIKFRKSPSTKMVTFISAAKLLLWNDIGSDSAKMLNVKSISTEDEAVIKGISREYLGLWFLVRSYDRIALFIAPNKETVDLFVAAINFALHTSPIMEASSSSAPAMTAPSPVISSSVSTV